MRILFFLLCNCWLAAASTLDSQVIKNLFANSSGLPADQIDKIKFENFTFDVGVAGSQRIVTSMKGGSATLKLGDDRRSLLRIRIFAQKRYDKYVEDLLIPLALFQGVQSDNAKAALDDDKLKETWRSGNLASIGNYCVGQHLPGIGSGTVNAGFFFYDEYGFCMQVSTPAESGVSLDSLEEVGRGVIKEIAKVLKNEKVSPNPLVNTGPFAFSKSIANARRATELSSNDKHETHTPKPNKNLEPSQSSHPPTQLGFWAFGFGAIVVLLAMLLVWWQRSKKPS
jgi:hypothetical protein